MGSGTARRFGRRRKGELQPVARPIQRSGATVAQMQAEVPPQASHVRSSQSATTPAGEAALNVETISVASAEDDDSSRVFRPRGENGVKFDVNEEAWPNADLAIRATYEGALIDGLPADKVKAGDEREIQQMKDLQLYSWVKDTSQQIDSAHRLGSTIEGE